MIIYLLVLVLSFIVGKWDGGDITVFVLFSFFGAAFAVDFISQKIKELRRIKKIVIIKSR